ncbi:MAG: TRAP transporter small permease [Alphaproteobacteria bacterium]|nr:MAG: TRAP transporter small permease [Alphaproteobacteria bacterium]
MHRFFLGLSKLMAIIGGAVLSALVALVVLSIVGREINALLHSDFAQTHMKGLADWLLALALPGPWGPISIGPVNGDYELVEAGMAFTIFAFLPLAQMSGSHATVDVFTSMMSERTNRVLRAISEVAFAVVLVIIAIQLLKGTESKMHRHQTTFLLQFPVWWAYAASLVGASVAAVVSIYTAIVRVAEMVTGHEIMPHGEGAGH